MAQPLDAQQNSFVRRFRRMVIVARASSPQPESKKRNYTDSFGEREYEKERYGQEISPEFFETEYGHAVTE